MNMLEPKRGQPADEIDLVAFFERVYLFLQKHARLFVVAVLLGLSTGYLIYLNLPRVFKSRLILHSYTLSNLDYIQVIDNWNEQLHRGEKRQLEETMGSQPATLKALREIKGTEIQKVFTPANPNGFYVDVFVTDNNVLPDLQAGIIRGLGNIDYIHKQVELRKANLNTLIADVKSEISQLDTTREKVNHIITYGQTHSSSLMLDVTGLNRQVIDLNEKLLGYQQELAFAGPVQVLQGFSSFNQPAGPHLVVWLGLGLIAFLAIAYAYALIQSIYSRISARKKYETRQPIHARA